jgi:hypothetical protein
VADRGYFKSEQILACHDAGITAYVTKETSGPRLTGVSITMHSSITRQKTNTFGRLETLQQDQHLQTQLHPGRVHGRKLDHSNWIFFSYVINSEIACPLTVID